MSRSQLKQFLSRLLKISSILMRLSPIKAFPDGNQIISLGSPYGKKSVVDTPELWKADVILAGVGEDISFDLELMAKFSSRLILVDPTERSARHVAQVLQQESVLDHEPYSPTGRQPISAYDLSAIDRSRIIFINKALWVDNQNLLTLNSPRNPNHVSFSRVNRGFQIFRHRNGKFTFPAISIRQLLMTYELKNLALLKLDVEGCALEILEDMFQLNIHPGQLLVEIEEFNYPSLHNLLRVIKYKKLLRSAGYTCVFVEDTEFVFVKTF